jgi:23S rRNA (cytidine1920-2'-O)/16S rRNA (cytidine1409-2'-O)-methyltransferase
MARNNSRINVISPEWFIFGIDNTRTYQNQQAAYFCPFCATFALDFSPACGYAMGHMKKMRLDVLLVERGLASSREKGRRLIMAGQVRVNGELSDKPGRQVAVDAAITVDEGLPYVSRGGLKLQAALEHFEINVQGWVVADVGASTGGFTDCLLQRGASRIYAIDVGYGQLAWSLRQDPRVVIIERTNARYLEALPEPVNLVTLDASFISLKLLLPVVAGWFGQDGGQAVPLIKPQFEAGRRQVGKGGVVRDPAVHRQVLTNLLNWVIMQGWGVWGIVPSPLRGPAGNVEFLAHLKLDVPSTLDIETAVENALASSKANNSGRLRNEPG